MEQNSHVTEEPNVAGTDATGNRKSEAINTGALNLVLARPHQYGGLVAELPFREKRLDNSNETELAQFLAQVVDKFAGDDGGRPSSGNDDDANDAAEDNSNKLEGVTFSTNSIGVEAARLIGDAFQQLPGMRAAYMANVFGSRNLDEIPPAIDSLVRGYTNSHCFLKHFDFSDNAFGEAALSKFMPLFESETLFNVESFILNNNGLGPSGGKMLADFLRRLYTNCCNKRGESNPPPLRQFVCGRNRLENEGITNLSKSLALYHQTLDSITVPQNGIFEDGMTTFMANIKDCRELTELDVSDNCVKNKGTDALIANLPDWNKLEFLDLSSTLLGNGNAVRLSAALGTHCAKTLTTLCLNACEIDLPNVLDELAENFCKLEAVETISLIENESDNADTDTLMDRFNDVFQKRRRGSLVDCLILAEDDGNDENGDGEHDYEEVSENDEGSAFENVGEEFDDSVPSQPHTDDDRSQATDDDYHTVPAVTTTVAATTATSANNSTSTFRFGSTTTTATTTTTPPKLFSFGFSAVSTTNPPPSKLQSGGAALSPPKVAQQNNKNDGAAAAATLGNNASPKPFVFGSLTTSTTTQPPFFSSPSLASTQVNSSGPANDNKPRLFSGFPEACSPSSHQATATTSNSNSSMPNVPPAGAKYLNLSEADLDAVVPQPKALMKQFYAARNALNQSPNTSSDALLAAYSSLFKSSKIAQVDKSIRSGGGSGFPVFGSPNLDTLKRRHDAFELMCIKVVDVFTKNSMESVRSLFNVPLKVFLTDQSAPQEGGGAATNENVDDNVVNNCCTTLRIMLQLTNFVDLPVLTQWAQLVRDCGDNDLWKPVLVAENEVEKTHESDAVVGLKLLIAEANTILSK